MLFSNLVHLKPLLMVLTAAAGTLTGGVMVSSYTNSLTRNQGSFLLALNPSSMMLAQNTSATSTLTVTSLNDYSGSVTLSVSYIGTRIMASISPASVTVQSNSAESTLSVTAPTAMGNYSVVVTGISNSHGKTTYSATMLTVQVVSNHDFTIVASPSVITNLAGTTSTTTIIVTSVSSFAGSVSLGVATPFGYITVSGGQSPLTLIGGGIAKSTLSIATNASTPLGVYTLMVTGTSGFRVHTATISLTVVDPTPPPIVEKLVVNSYQFYNRTTLILNVQNTGNNTITLQSYTVKDPSGDAWSLTGLTGPTVAPGANAQVTLEIGVNCLGCVYTGITGLFLQFNPGVTYTVVLTSALPTQFTNSVTYN